MTKIQYIYRMTHIENIPHILQYGITSHNSPNKNPNYKNIGDKSLIDVRESMKVDVGGREVDLKDYTPFYFGTKMPMLYIVQNSFNNVERVRPEDIVYIACSIQEVTQQCLDYIFSDGHARDAFTLFFDSDRISEVADIVDMNAVKSTYWGGEDNLDIKRRKQAEFLVKGDIPADCIKKFGCYNQDAKGKLVGMGVPDEMIQVTPKAYF